MSERAHFVLVAAGLLVVLNGCASAGVEAAASQPPEPLIQAQAEVPEDLVLDVGIRIFSTGMPDTSGDPLAEAELEKQGVFREIRRGEARLFPLRLADTLQKTGQWGAVRVIPAPTDSVDLTVRGTIVESTGRKLVLDISARDASGRRWLNRRYKRQADPRGYAEVKEGEEQVDPFASLYHEIANDLLAAREDLKTDQIREIRQIAYLRFAADLVPSTFGSYLERDGARYRAVSLPAEDDPMLTRIAEIRERDYLLVDTLHEQFDTFGGEMQTSYAQWRAYSYEEEVALAKLRRQARMQKAVGIVAILGGLLADGDSRAEQTAREAAVIGGTMAVQAGFAKSQEAKIHREAIRELAASFDSEVEPMVVEVEGRTLRLTGTAQTQYEEWRALLREILTTETGLPLDPDPTAETAAEGTPPG